MPPRHALIPLVAAVALLIAVPATAPAAGPPLPQLPSMQGFRGVDPDRLAGGMLRSPDGHAAAVLLGMSNHYAMTTWWPRVAPALLDRVVRIPSARDSSDAVRRLGMQAMSLAVSLRTGAYDPARAGASQARARAAVVRIVTVVAGNHRANRSDGWGTQGQSALSSSFSARAAWLLWDDLPTSTQTLAQSMLEYEADLASQIPAQYLRDRSGKVVRSGNSAAEEDAWQALPLQLATAMLPGHRHWTAWRHAQVALMLSAWSRPQDVDSATLINGAPLSAWLGGSNVEANGIVVNHHRIAPDYSTNLYQNVDAVLVNALAGIPTPEAARWGLDHVYAALVKVSFARGAYAAPGGTVYQQGRVYYPQGCDWGTGQALPFALVDAQAAAFGFGNDEAAAHEAEHLRAQASMQSRFRDGRTFASNAEYSYVGREEHTAQLAAQLYLTKLVRDRSLVTFTDEPYFAPAARDAVGLILRRPVPFTELGVVRG